MSQMVLKYITRNTKIHVSLITVTALRKYFDYLSPLILLHPFIF